ncbi:MAG: hypothetical protein ACO3YZ_03585 [Candidatus Nanopelagicaceae bacterium]
MKCKDFKQTLYFVYCALGSFWMLVETSIDLNKAKARVRKLRKQGHTAKVMAARVVIESKDFYEVCE